MELRQTLDTLGVDVDTTLHRFGGNEPLLARFVRRFPQDETYQTLKTVLAEPVWDLAQIERLAHTLKGTSANLGFQILSDHCHELVQAIRAGETQPEKLQPLVDDISGEYEKIIAAINALGQ